MKQLITLAFLVFSFSAFAQKDSTKPNKRPIDKVKVWVNGVTYDADDIDVICAYEDYVNVVRWYYTLTDSIGAIVASGNVELRGDKYKDFASKPNHADRAVLLVMRELNLKQRQQRADTQAARQTAAGTASKQ